MTSSSSTMLAPLSLEELIGYCRDDIAHYQRYGSSINAYPLELFGRAIAQGDQAAWASLWELYSPLVRYWVSRCAPSEIWLDGQEAESLTNAAFAKFSRALTPAKLASFPTTAAILAYLKRCVHSVVSDEARSHQARLAEVSLDAITSEPVSDDPTTEIISKLSAQELWHVIQEELTSEEERWLFFLSIIQDMKPREICAQQPHRFPTADYVLQKKRSLFQRLVRSHRIYDLIAENPQDPPACQQEEAQCIRVFTEPGKAEKRQERIPAPPSRPKRKEAPTTSHLRLHRPRQTGQACSVKYYQQVAHCGKKTCGKCRDGIGHGPYWYAYRYENGRIITTYLGKTLPSGEEAPTVIEPQPERAIKPAQSMTQPKPEKPSIIYHRQKTLCGKDRCRKCREGIGHGPYWFAYKLVNGKTIRSYVGKSLPADVTADDSGTSAWVKSAESSSAYAISR